MTKARELDLDPDQADAGGMTFFLPRPQDGMPEQLWLQVEAIDDHGCVQGRGVSSSCGDATDGGPRDGATVDLCGEVLPAAPGGPVCAIGCGQPLLVLDGIP